MPTRDAIAHKTDTLLHLQREFSLPVEATASRVENKTNKRKAIRREGGKGLIIPSPSNNQSDGEQDLLRQE